MIETSVKTDGWCECLGGGSDGTRALGPRVGDLHRGDARTGLGRVAIDVTRPVARLQLVAVDKSSGA